MTCLHPTKSVRRALALGLAFTVATPLTAFPIASPAAAEDARIGKRSFSIQSIQPVFMRNSLSVVSTDGQRWNAIEGKPDKPSLTFIASGRIETKGRGFVEFAGFFAGSCSGRSTCGQYKTIWQGNMNTRDWRFREEVHVPASALLPSSEGINPDPQPDRIVAACNQLLGSDATREGRTIPFSFTLTVSANTRRGKLASFVGASETPFEGGDFTMQASAPIEVRCVPFASESQLQEARPRSVSLSVADANGTQCPRNVRVRTSISYDRPAIARFRIVANGEKLRWLKVRARRETRSDGRVQYVVRREETVLAKGGRNSFKAKVQGGSESPAVTHELSCPDFAVTSAHLAYGMPDNGKCPRQVWETATFRTNGPGRLRYQIVHENGLVVHEKRIRAKLHGDHYKAVGQRVLVLPETDADFHARVKNDASPLAHSGWTRVRIACEARTTGQGVGSMRIDRR